MYPLFDVRSLQFLPLSEVKASLSEKIRDLLAPGRRIAITTNGRPTAVLISYQDYLQWMNPPFLPSEGRVFSLNDWRREFPKRKEIRQSLLSLFDVERLSRKGRKQYKTKALREIG